VAEVTYYYNNYSVNEWTDEAYMVDGILTNYAYTSKKGDIERLLSTTCPGNDLGTIIKVEIRCYGYGDGDDRIDLSWAIDRAPEYQLVMPSSANWSSYADVTSDPIINGWTWAKIKNPSRFFHVEKAATGKSNTTYCSKVEIRVTYTPSGGTYYHGLKVQGVGELALCDVGTNPLRIRKGSTTYGVELVATDDPNASALRIKTGTGIKAIRKYT